MESGYSSFHPRFMDTQLQDVRRLEAEFADAMTRMYAVGNSLARLRASIELEGTGPATTAPPMPQPTPTPASAPEAQSALAAAAPAPAAPTPAKPTPATQPAATAPTLSWWQREGAVTRALAVAGAVVTLIGVAMLLALAMQQGWFGPELRVGLGVVLALSLVGAGHVVRRRERAAGRSSAAPVALAATGYAAGYLDVVAVTTVYGWLPATAGLAVGGLVAVTGLLLARRWESQLLAVLTVLGATLLAPTVAGGVGDEVALFAVVLSGAALLARGDRGWPLLAIARTGPTSLLVAAATVVNGSSPSAIPVAAAVALTLLAVAGAVSAGRHTPTDLTGSAMTALASGVLLASLAPYGERTRTTGLALTAVGFAVAFAVTARRPVGPVPTPLALVLGTISGVSAVLAVTSGAPDRWLTTALIGVALGYAAAAVTTRSRVTLVVAGGTSVVAALAYLVHPGAYISLGTAAEHDAAVALLDSLLAAGVAALGAWGVDVVRGLPSGVRRSTRVAALVAGLGTSAVAVVSTGLLIGGVLDATAMGFVAGHALATVLWMLVSAWLLLHGLRASRHRELTLRLGLGLAAVSVAKLFLFDLATLDGLWRVAAFIVTGLLLLASGTAYAKALDRSRPTGAA